MAGTHILVDEAVTRQDFSQILGQGGLSGASRASTREEMVGVCILEDYGECAPYANDDYPLLGHRSVRILSGCKSVGNLPEDLAERSSAPAGIFLAKTITATTSKRKHP